MSQDVAQSKSEEKQTKIACENVWFRYDRQWVLKDVSLRVQQGDIFGIVGPNGGGKTTLLRLLLGLERPQKGTVRVLGLDPYTNRSHRQWIGYLPQITNVDRQFPAHALDVVMMGLYSSVGLFRRPGKKERIKAMEALELVDMADMADRPYGALSGGQQQRVNMARTLVHSPELLVLDEPSTGVDVVAQESFYRLLVRLRDEHGMTILMVTHDVGVVSSFVDKVACLRRMIHFHGDPQTCMNSDMISQVWGDSLQVILHDEHCATCQRKHD